MRTFRFDVATDFNRRAPRELPRKSRRNSILTLILLACIVTGSSAHGQVTFDRIVNSAKEPQNWMTYSGDYSGKRFSALDQLSVINVQSMVPKWVYQTAATGKLETSPLVVDGILYA